jgi:Fur family iron response transcriptional regulator
MDIVDFVGASGLIKPMGDIFSPNFFVDLSLTGSDISSDERRAENGVTGWEQQLREAGLRPTRQRLMLGELLFAKGHRHITAEALYEEALARRMRLSLATVYNTVRQFTEIGLLRRIAADASKSFFDTNTSVHPHFYLEDEDMMVDVPQDLILERVPEGLPGYEVSRLDVVVHIRRKKSLAT